MKSSVYAALIISLSLLVALFFAGCGGEQGEYEGVGFGAYGPGFIGPAAGYEGFVFAPGIGEEEEEEEEEGEEEEGERGRDPNAPSVRITAYDLRPKAGPVVDRFNVRLHNVQYSRNPFRINCVGSSGFTARVSEENINCFLNRRLQTSNVEVRNIYMSFAPRGVEMTATANIDGRRMTVCSSGTLEPEGQTRVVYVPGTFTADGTQLPTETQQEILNQVNPVANLRGLNCSPTIRSVTPHQHYISLSGPVIMANPSAVNVTLPGNR